MTHSRNLLLTLLALACLVLAVPVHAQSGKISGRVVDATTDEPLPGVNVIITAKWQGGETVSAPSALGAATGVDGYYTILNVPPGTYDVTATFVGFTPLTKSQVQVSSGLTSSVTFELEEQVLEGEEVTVVARRDVVRPDISSTVEFISPDRVTESPTTRLDEFVGKMKGVELVSTSEGNGLSVRGGSIRETDVRIDGLSVRDARSGNSYINFNATTIEEVQVRTGGFEAKHGGFQSGLVNVVTKEGSRDRFTADVKMDFAPVGQKHYFDEGLWEPGSMLYEAFAGEYAMSGIHDSLLISPDNPNGVFPYADPFIGFRGWEDRRYLGQSLAGMTAEEKRALWLAQHPAQKMADMPDYFVETAVTGPFFLPKTTFLAGARYEDTQFAFPMGPRDSYQDYNAQLKLTTRFTPRTKLSVSGMYAKIKTLNYGRSSTYGGSIVGGVDRFNFLTNTRSSVESQASLLGSDFGFQQMFNRSLRQTYDERMFISGASLTHSLSSTAFFEVEAQFSYKDNTVAPVAFSTADPDNYIRIGSREWMDVSRGAPDGGVKFVDDVKGDFRLSGGLAAVDSSSTWNVGLKGNFTKQAGRHHELEAGFGFQYDHYFVYSGTNNNSTFLFIPGSFQYLTATPMTLSLYVQDKMEYEGMVATVGVRADYFNPMRDGFEVGVPPDPGYAEFGNMYGDLPGGFGSYERWVAWRELAKDPPGWPDKDVGGQFVLAPRLGTSFPITTSSKLYFNYGVFYQRPNFAAVYNQLALGGSATIPTPELKPEKTSSFEFGYEQSVLNNYVLNATFYYKDVANRPMPVTYLNYYETIAVRTYSNDAYRDIRGLEMRFEKNRGRFFTFWANFDYQVTSSGQTGLAFYHEDPLKQREAERSPVQRRSIPRPKAYVNLNFHTPSNFGPELLGNYPIGGIYVNPLVEWRDGGYVLMSVDPQNPERETRVDIVDYKMVDLRVSKQFNIPAGEMEFVLTVQNLFNFKRLTYSNMQRAQLDAYKNSLKLPHLEGDQHGDDKFGEWDKDHIDVGWYTAPVFLNPRRLLLGMRLSF